MQFTNIGSAGLSSPSQNEALTLYTVAARHPAPCSPGKRSSALSLDDQGQAPPVSGVTPDLSFCAWLVPFSSVSEVPPAASLVKVPSPQGCVVLYPLCHHCWFIIPFIMVRVACGFHLALFLKLQTSIFSPVSLGFLSSL